MYASTLTTLVTPSARRRSTTCRYMAAKSVAVMPEPAVATTSFSGSWLRARKNIRPYASARVAKASMRASWAPAATSAHVVPYATFQFSSSTRGWAASAVMAISAAVGNFSSPLWYWWKIVAVRPVTFSQSRRAWWRGVSVKPPAAAPHSTPQVGTSRAPVVHVAGTVVGDVVCAGVGAGVGRVQVRSSSGPPVVASPSSTDRSRVTAVVADDLIANAYVPVLVTHFDTSNDSTVSVAFGVIVTALVPVIAGALAAVTVFSDQPATAG